MSSLSRRQRRGKVDQFGNKIPKRFFNNKKRTKGRQKQEDVKYHYTELIRRMRYIRSLIRLMKKNSETLDENNWVQVIRKYDKEQLIFDDYEKQIIFTHMNNENK